MIQITDDPCYNISRLNCTETIGIGKFLKPDISLPMKRYFAQGYFRRKASKFIRFVTHPVFVFVSLQCICIAITVMWVVWFVDQNQAINEVQNTFKGFQWDTSFGLTLLVVGCVLLGMLIVGTIFLFVFAQRQTNFIRKQRNFVASVTHELRSPLASLQLGFETLQKRNVPPEIVTQMYDMARKDILRLSRLVEQILLSSRLDRGLHAGDAFEDLSCHEVIEEALDEQTNQQPNLSHRVKISGDLESSIIAQRATLRIILGNLIENALKYSNDDSPIEISFQKEGKEVQFRVKDYGFGMSKSDCRKVFKMFHRAGIARKKAIPGTGLGLYIVRTLVKNLGGKAWAESPGYGQGSTFFVSLPKDTRTANSTG